MKRNIINSLAVCTLCATMALPVYSQEKVYTVEQCRNMALEQNARILNAKNNLSGAQESSKEAFTNYFPTISASGMGFNANKGTAKMVMGEGMEMSMIKNGIVANVTAVQPLFAGGQIVNGNKLAKVGVDINRLQLEQAENEVELTAEQYFWQVVTLQEKMKTVVAIDSMLQRLCKDVEISVKAGITTRNDLLQVELKRNDIESSRINLENNINLCKMLLGQYIGEENTDFQLASDVSFDTLPASPVALYTEPNSVLSLTPEYKLLEKNVRANILQKRVEVGKYLPTVGIGAGYMYHDILDNDRSFAMAFASVSLPISNWWGGSHAIKKQKLQLLNAKNDQSDKSQLLVIRMQKAWNDVQDAYKQLQIARKSIEQSTENLRLNNDYYKAGTTTMNDLLQAQSIYQQSKDKYIDAYSSYNVKTLDYLQSTGR